jgi:hypothetical protein
MSVCSGLDHFPLAHPLHRPRGARASPEGPRHVVKPDVTTVSLWWVARRPQPGEAEGSTHQAGVRVHSASGVGAHRLQQRVHFSSHWIKQLVQFVWLRGRSDHVEQLMSMPEGRQVRNGRPRPQAEAERQRW